VLARLQELSRQGRSGEAVAWRPGLKKDRLTCRFRKASFDALVGPGFPGWASNRLQEIVTGSQRGTELKTRRGHYEIPEYL
jgi:hypothetical protein